MGENMFKAALTESKSKPTPVTASSSTSSATKPAGLKRNGSINSMFAEKRQASHTGSLPTQTKSLKRPHSQSGSINSFFTRPAAQQSASKPRISSSIASYLKTGATKVAEPPVLPQTSNDPVPIQRQKSIIGSALRQASLSSFEDVTKKSTRFDSTESVSSSEATSTTTSITKGTSTTIGLISMTGTNNKASKTVYDYLFDDDDDDEFVKFDTALSKAKITKVPYIQPSVAVQRPTSPSRVPISTASRPTSTKSTAPRLSAPPSKISSGRFSHSASSFSASEPSSYTSSTDSNIGQTLANSSISQLNKPKKTPLYHGYDSEAALRLRQRKRKPETINLNNEQRAIVDLVVNRGQSLFYTGAAGTGKSVLLREIIKRLVETHRREDAVAITAPTGLAALSIGGQTLHRFAGTGLGKEDKLLLVAKVMKNKRAVTRWGKCKVLIIDEVSMCDGIFLDKLDAIAKAVKKLEKPFGGIQCVFTGDFFQLPPVPEPNQQCTYAFESEVWKKMITHAYELQEVFRQQGDIEFVDMLNALRKGNIKDPVMMQKFKDLARPICYQDGIEPTHLFPLRWQVEMANKNKLEALPGPDQVYDALDHVYEGEAKVLDNVSAAKTLTLRIDAQVMMIKNLENGLVNGSLGKIKAFLTATEFQILQNYYVKFELMMPIVNLINASRDSSGSYSFSDKSTLYDIDSRMKALDPKQLKCYTELRDTIKASSHMDRKLFPVVDFVGHGVIMVEYEDFTVEDAAKKKITATRTQLPLVLSWALSIHKSQGQTLQRVSVNVGKAFENGQVYVALSRAVSKETLQVEGFSENAVKVDPRVQIFYQNLNTAQHQAAPSVQKIQRPSSLSSKTTVNTFIKQEVRVDPYRDNRIARMGSTGAVKSDYEAKRSSRASLMKSTSALTSRPEPAGRTGSIIARLPKTEGTADDPFDII